MPLFTQPIHEANDCHHPAGSPQGGQFCSKGGSANLLLTGEMANLSTGSGWVPTGVKFTPTVSKAVELVQKMTGVTDVSVAAHPHAVETSVILASLLSEMRAKGYDMPERVEIGMGLTALTPSGRMSVRRSSDAQGRTRTVRITIPRAAPNDMPVDTVVNKAFAGVTEAGVDKYAVRSMRDLLLHEMGHVQAGVDHDFAVLGQMRKLSPEWIQKAAGSVSQYATTNANEFLAEAFTRLYRGEKLSPEAQSMYTMMRGPKIRS